MYPGHYLHSPRHFDSGWILAFNARYTENADKLSKTSVPFSNFSLVDSQCRQKDQFDGSKSTEGDQTNFSLLSTCLLT